MVSWSTQRHDIQLTAAQAAYVAALIDGEGCITAHRQGRLLYPRVAIKMRTAEPVHTVADWLRSPTPRQRRDSGMWDLTWQGIRAVEVLLAVHEYLILKRDQADLALELASLGVGRGHIGEPRKTRGKIATPPEVIARMFEISDRLKAAKRPAA